MFFLRSMSKKQQKQRMKNKEILVEEQKKQKGQNQICSGVAHATSNRSPDFLHTEYLQLLLSLTLFFKIILQDS